MIVVPRRLFPVMLLAVTPFGVSSWCYAAAAGSTAAAGAAPAAVEVAVATSKVCQLTGDVDWDTGAPTAAKTLTNFGLDATDLGYPVEHDGKLLFLFGDTWPTPPSLGRPPEVTPDDAVGYTTRGTPPRPVGGRCLELQIDDQHAHQPTRATIIGPRSIEQGFFNVPSGGVSVNGDLYGFFWTDHCSFPHPLAANSATPLARPAAGGRCPETDTRNSVGRGVLARSTDDGATFSDVVDLPQGFVYTTALDTAALADVSGAPSLGVVVMGVPRYRASVPYVALAPEGTFADPTTWRFFAGLTSHGAPTWVSYDTWQRSRAGSGNPPQWMPPGAPEIFAAPTAAARTVGELSLTWNRQLQRWLLLHGDGAGGMVVRVARAPWGPWSAATKLLGGEAWLPCHLLMAPGGCGTRRDYWPTLHANGKFMPGGLYAPFALDRYTTPGPPFAGATHTATLYWLVSTWNPYEVAVMRTSLAVTDLP